MQKQMRKLVMSITNTMTFTGLRRRRRVMMRRNPKNETQIEIKISA
jgi:hypothetical protein